MKKLRQFLNYRSIVELSQFLGMWFLVYIVLDMFGLVSHSKNGDISIPIIVSLVITALIFTIYRMGYEKGAKDVKTGEYQEPFVNPFQ